MRTLLLLASVTALVGCKGKPEHQPAPSNAALGAAGSAGSAGPRPAPNIELPHSDGSPIKPTTAKLDEATMHKLQDMTFRGFKAVPHGFNPKTGMVEVHQRTPDHPTIWVVITVASCEDKVVLPACLPIDLAKWNTDPRLTELKNILPPELRAQPDTVFDVGTTDLDGAKMIYTYQLAQTISKPSAPTDTGSSFNPGGFAYSDAYFLYYNDGVNQIRVVAEFKDDPKKTKEDMAKAVSREDLENVAKAFMDVYTHAW